MSTNPAQNMPELVLRGDLEWDAYEGILSNHFCSDFVSNPMVIGKHRIGIESHPWINNRHRTFWHLISEGGDNPERNVCPCRCERIRWPRHMIANFPSFKTWRNERGTRKNLLIATDGFDYIVVLAERRGFYFLWTAYCVEFTSRQAALKKEYDAYQAEKASAL